MLFLSNHAKALLTVLLSALYLSPVYAQPFSEFTAIDVRLINTNQAEYNLITGEAFSIDISATVHCGWRTIRTSFKFYALNQEVLGRPFELNRHADYSALRRQGDLLLKTRKFKFGCDEAQLITANLNAPREPGIYYVGGCIPTLRDPDGEIFSNTNRGSIFNCTAPLVLHVAQRPTPDLITRIQQITPVKSEYAPGEQVTVKMVVKNIGNGVSAPSRLSLRRSAYPNANLYNSLSAASEIIFSPIRPGQSKFTMVRIDLPNQARTSYYTGCVSVNGFGDDPALPGGYTEAEIWRDNNCSRSSIIRTTNSRLPSVYVDSTLPSQSVYPSDSQISLTAGITNNESVQFKGGYVVYEKPLNSMFNLIGNRPGLFSLHDGSKIVLRNGIQLNPGNVSQTLLFQSPSETGRYQYKVCMIHGREVFGCGNPVDLQIQ